ncbi:MAG: hypothetical protein WC358_07995 [Ignavibacteria bacterium]|jgi:hypothetical protein
MDDFWVTNSRKFDQAQTEPRKFEEFDFEALLSKYGPDGLWELADKLRDIAREDADFAKKLDDDIPF